MSQTFEGNKLTITPDNIQDEMLCKCIDSLHEQMKKDTQMMEELFYSASIPGNIGDGFYHLIKIEPML